MQRLVAAHLLEQKLLLFGLEEKIFIITSGNHVAVRNSF
jgi:hypothetical protein